ncbi:MAG: hypothetical protein V1747_10825 [Candidatus Omnitrophota bacterium]
MENLEKEEFCPMYVDYVRECAEVFGNVSREINTTVRFCVSANHVNCPFFKFSDNPKQYCPGFISCDMCKYFKNTDFENFIKITNDWCLSNKFANCARFRLRKTKTTPPENLMPDGSMR